MSGAEFNDPERRRRWQRLVQTLNPKIDPTVMRLMDEMRLVAHALRLIGEDSLEASGLTYAQFRVLMALFVAAEIEGRDELNPSEISQRQGTSRNTISTLIRSLEEDGCIERRLDQADRRRFNISLTPAGRDLVVQHARRHMNVVGRCFAVFDGDEQATLSRLLVKLGQQIELARQKPVSTDRA